MATHHARSAVDWRPAVHPRTYGVLALAATKSLDVLTTLLGLGASPAIVEANPSVAAVMGVLGVEPTLLVVSILTVVAITATTELAATNVGRGSDTAPAALVRVVGYGAPSLVHLGVATHNLLLVATV